jgi:uroporphyrinogen III methyltransferase / synthase
MVSELINQTLSGRSVLVSPNEAQGELATQLTRQGARVLAWPILDVGEAENLQALDEAIENLFGYDWLIFSNVNAVNFFLRRFQTLGHEISDLDGLRVCGVAEATVHRLEESQVHVDVIPDRLSTQAIFHAVETYVGGREALRGLNFLVPTAGSSRGYLLEKMEESGARVDLVAAYRTTPAKDSGLVRINALLAGGGIDCVVFTSGSDVRDLAAVLDTNDLGRVFADIGVVCISEIATQTANELGLTADIVINEPEALVQAMASYFRAG